MPFPENTPLPEFESDLAGFPADISAPVPTLDARAENVRARKLFRRFERPALSAGRTAALHITLFLVTLMTTTLAGIELTRGGIDLLPLGFGYFPAAPQPGEWVRGLWFALPFLGVLTVHEFGHYFVARYNRVRTSLPYYLPFPLGLGTFGAIIRIKDRIFSRREFFDKFSADIESGQVLFRNVRAYVLRRIFQLQMKLEASAIRGINLVNRV